jgi:pilus assembly protein Flp/PilA
MKRLISASRQIAARVQGSALVLFFSKKEEGASLVEYGLLVGLIAVVCIGAITLLGQDISSLFSRIAQKLSNVGT